MLPENEQKKYLDAARRTANGIALQDSTALCVAIQLAAKERKDEINYDGTGISIRNGSE